MFSSTDIIAAMKDERISISDFDPSRLGTNSYDLLLGNWFYDVRWNEDGPCFVGPLRIADGERVYIPVGGTLLAMTKDVIGTFENVVGILKAKSSIGRVGITVCRDAGMGDIGYFNHWTLEMTAYVVHGLPFLIAGEPVAQISFHKTHTPPITEYAGQYRSSDWPECMIPRRYRDGGSDGVV